MAAYRTRLQFRKVSDTNDPAPGDVVFYVNLAGNLVKVDESGTETVIAIGETVAAHEGEADPHPQYLTASV
jgi:hypothetical protein